MLNKFKKYNSTFSFKKVGILLGALMLTIGLGNGMNMAFAGQGIDSLLATWFASEKDKAIEDIDRAIEEEIASLSKELKVAVEKEKQRAEEDLAAFTIKEKDLRTRALKEHAATLKAKIEIDLTKEKEAIIAELDAKQKQAIEDLENPAVPIKPTPKPEVKPVPAPEPGAEVKPEPTPEPELEIKPVLPSESETEPKSEPASEAETAPITEPTSE
ncbi:hypothetical protein [Sporosarcina psychrophila]|uniref:hypothetical protein n=1 Tax=Sporosarcina psychrophila TaxID=1476 RepID=UPI00078E5C35|nr:hypothetical protein [Sporosarcina psychrophila]AMQ07731.1 hypothetical protein AZE41_18280 [Sporosarcina psychrophila]